MKRSRIREIADSLFNDSMLITRRKSQLKVATKNSEGWSEVKESPPVYVEGKVFNTGPYFVRKCVGGAETTVLFGVELTGEHELKATQFSVIVNSFQTGKRTDPFEFASPDKAIAFADAMLEELNICID